MGVKFCPRAQEGIIAADIAVVANPLTKPRRETLDFLILSK